MRELEDALTEVTARAGRAGRLPAVAAVRARGEQRRRRQRAGATTLSVLVLSGLVAGLVNSSVLSSAEPLPPAHSGVPVPGPSRTTTPAAPTPSAAAPSATSRPVGSAPDDPSRSVGDQRRLSDAQKRAAADQEAAQARAKAAARETGDTGAEPAADGLERLPGVLPTSTTAPISTGAPTTTRR